MAHQYKVGDKVRIKKREGKFEDYPCGFTDIMSREEGKIFTIEEIEELSPIYKKDKFYNGDDHVYSFERNGYKWHSSMFEPVLEDLEPITFTSLQEGDLVPICGMIGKITDDTGDEEYYLDFDCIVDQLDHFTCCDKLRELVPDFEKIASKSGAIQINPGCFPEFSTISDLVKFTQAVNNAYNSKKSITTSKTLNENEIKFQRAKASSKRGTVPTGRAICGRRRKTTIKCGHLSNTTCYC